MLVQRNATIVMPAGADHCRIVLFSVPLFLGGAAFNGFTVIVRDAPGTMLTAMLVTIVETVLRVQDLQCDFAVELLVISDIDVPHPTLTDDVCNADVTEPPAKEFHGGPQDRS